MKKNLSEMNTHKVLIDTVANLKGKFTPNEWKFMANTLNGTMFRPEQRIEPLMLVYEFKDAQIYDGTADKWGVDIEALNAKVIALTASETDAVISRVEKYWGNCYGPGFKLEEWAKF